jgi:Tol biopolymer transport system component
MRIVRILVVLVGACAAFADPAGAALLEEKIVFASNRDGDYDIYSMDPDGSNVVQLTDAPGIDINPAISPDGTRIAYNRPSAVEEYDTWLMNADGSDQHLLAVAVKEPTWTPDSAKVLAGSLGHGDRDGVIYAINADGSGGSDPLGGTKANPIGGTDANRDNFDPAVSADGTKLAWIGQIDDFLIGEGLWTATFTGTSATGRVNHSGLENMQNDRNPDWSPDSTKLAFARAADICKMNRDGSGLECIPVSGGGPSWSPGGAQIAFSTGRDGNSEIYKMNADGTAQIRLTNNPAVDHQPDWGYISTLIGPGYPRPKGASPLRLALVPAYDRCTNPNNTHANPLAFGSCSPAQLSSQYLTTGTPDANGRPARMSAHLLLAAIPGGPSEADDADVQITARLNDVLNKDLSDYTGELRANLPIRITDRDNLPPVGGPGPGTTQPFLFGFDIPCTADPGPLVGSDCSLSTTVDTLVPGAIKETRRTIWQMGQVRVFDGGADGDGSTAGDNTVFAAQGVFIP